MHSPCGVNMKGCGMAFSKGGNPPFNILLAEDSSADVLLIRRALKDHAVECDLHITRDGAEAIHYLTKLDEMPTVPSLDLMLLDMHLPKHDGEDILKRLRSTENYAQTPVIVMTSSDSPAVETLAFRNAALHFFRKPSSLQEFMLLGSIVKNVLAGRSARGEG